MNTTAASAAPADLQALLHGRLHDPFRYLGLHRDADGWVLRMFHPHAESVSLRMASGLSESKIDAIMQVV